MPYLDQAGLTRLWDRMKAAFAPKSHTHKASDITGLSGAAADYVVAAGTCDFWTWRMWESGVAECWGSTGTASVPVRTAWGSLFEGPAHSNGFPGNTGSSALAFSATVGGVKYSKLFC